LIRQNPLFDDVRKLQGKYYYPSTYYSGFIAYKSADYSEALKLFKKLKNQNYIGRLFPTTLPAYTTRKKNMTMSFITHPGFTGNDKIQYALEMQLLTGKGLFEKKAIRKGDAILHCLHERDTENQ
jgi:hypothetical protein